MHDPRKTRSTRHSEVNRGVKHSRTREVVGSGCDRSSASPKLGADPVAEAPWKGRATCPWRVITYSCHARCGLDPLSSSMHANASSTVSSTYERTSSLPPSYSAAFHRALGISYARENEVVLQPQEIRHVRRDRDRASAAACNDRCGCPHPCPGGASCRCTTSGGDAEGRMDHKKCSCGDHCGCNPCSCGLWSPSGRGGPTAGADPVVRASLAPLEQQKAMQ
ncbi:uncharacterized protein J3R85_002386 [Psidium guajava]|nr:uncharacterized protein J3R85_002386 [Psidium guajava]